MLIGHQKLIDDFKNLAESGNLGHGYIFFGEPRVGKKLFAACLANYLETGEFSSPSQISQGETWAGRPKKILTDFLFIEPDSSSRISRDEIKEGKGTIGIDQVRMLRNFLWQKPTVSRRRTAVVNDAEAMTGEAQNAILKIAEEPPESSLLILVASDSESLWPTLSSRLQSVYFPPIGIDIIENWLVKTRVSAAKEAKIFANSSFGQPGLAFMLAKDADFKLLCENAEEFLKSGFWERRNFLKPLLDNDNFNLDKFLEAMLMIVSKSPSSEENRELWHKISALRRDATRYNVNPRLQLEALMSNQ